MKSELESMYSNNVWTLVDLPQGVKPIGCKWVYKKKRRVDGKVETYKARLVAKCYNKKNHVLTMRKLLRIIGYYLIYLIPFLYIIFLHFCILFVSFLCLLD